MLWHFSAAPEGGVSGREHSCGFAPEMRRLHGCRSWRNALQCNALQIRGFSMAIPAERMRAMRDRRRERGLRELRLIVPDARSPAVRRRIARQVATLDMRREQEALGWIEAVAEFDEP
jgi:hypothetical protein